MTMIVINNLAMWSTSNVKVCTLSRNYQNKYDTKESPTSNYTNNQNRDKGAFKTQLIAYLDIKISVKKGTYFNAGDYPSFKGRNRRFDT
ncbi:7080_t:CDS:2, partial [Entrophospora sp. SA101]